MSHWYTIAPLIDYEDSDLMPEGIHLTEHIRIAPVPDWAKSEEVLKTFSALGRLRVQRSTLALHYEYKAPPAVNNRDLDSIMKHQVAANQVISIACLACWIAMPSNICYDEVVIFESNNNSNPELRQTRYERAFVPMSVDRANVLSQDDYDEAAKLITSIRNLNMEGTTSTALQMLNHAITEMRFEIRFLLQWVAMEGLLGPEQPGETVHQIAERVAFFLKDDLREKRRMYSSVKKSYKWRSKIAHGAKLTKLKIDDALYMGKELETILRDILKRILLDEEILSIINGKGRDKYLGNLVFKD